MSGIYTVTLALPDGCSVVTTAQPDALPHAELKRADQHADTDADNRISQAVIQAFLTAYYAEFPRADPSPDLDAGDPSQSPDPA